jgi:GTPase KRas protein
MYKNHSKFKICLSNIQVTGEGFLLVYSVINRKSFENISNIYARILRIKESNNYLIFLVANKIYLIQFREVTEEQIREMKA